MAAHILASFLGSPIPIPLGSITGAATVVYQAIRRWTKSTKLGWHGYTED